MSQNQPDNRTREQKRADYLKNNPPKDVHTTGTTINEEAEGLKPGAGTTASSETPKSPEDKKEKGGIVKLIKDIPSTVWNKGVVPAYEFCKGFAMRGWGWCVNNYNAEVALYKSMGASKYFLDRGSKGMIKVLKLAALLTVAGFINSLMVNISGISLFDPTTLLFVAIAALVMIIAKSYKDQKEMGNDFSLKATGSHIVEAAIAA
jgi:hypothetical protein